MNIIFREKGILEITTNCQGMEIYAIEKFIEDFVNNKSEIKIYRNQTDYISIKKDSIEYNKDIN